VPEDRIEAALKALRNLKIRMSFPNSSSAHGRLSVIELLTRGPPVVALCKAPKSWRHPHAGGNAGADGDVIRSFSAPDLLDTNVDLSQRLRVDEG
jgi:hypothetical protein